jgi:predicted RNA-binding protein (TIGR00451 family)
VINIDELSKSYNFSIDALAHLKAVYGDELEKVIRSLKSPGKRYYFRVNTLKATPDEVIERFRSKGFNVKKHPKIEEALYLPVEGPFKVPVVDKRVVVDKFTAESVLQGAHVYAPGIVRCSKIRVNDEVAITDDFGQIVAAGVARMSETEILTRREGLAVEVTHPTYKVPSLRETEEFKEGLIYPQSFPAIVTCKVLDPQPGEKIADIAASPGGKTTAIAQLMMNEGLIYAVDRNREKMEKIKESVNRLGVKNVRLICHDARYLNVDFPEIRVKRTLVDPPCSALGVRPKLYEKAESKEIKALAEYQKQFMKSAAKITESKGIIVYSTCTMTMDENEEVVKFAVEECGLEVEEQEYFFGSPGFESIFPQASLTQRFHPHIHEDCPGYFIAKLKKR